MQLELLALVGVVLILLLLKLKPYLHHDKIASSSFTATETKKFKTVAVVGGSMAGMMAAKTMSSFAENVILLEQKQLKDTEPTALQSSHLHTLLKRGLNILNKMFPGLAAELRAIGAQPLDWVTSLRWTAVGAEGVMGDQHDDTYETLTMTRVFLDNEIRRRLESIPNIKVIDDATVYELKLDPSIPQKIIGLNFKDTYGETTSMDCDIVIDCSGNSGSISSLLKKQMRVDIPFSKIKNFLTYSTVMVEHKKKDSPFLGKSEQGKYFSCQYFLNLPPNLKGLGMQKTEVPYQYILTTVTCNKLKNVTSFEGYAEFAKGTAFEKEVARIMEEFEPVTPVKTFNKEGSIYRFFDKVSVQGYIALGDAICSFNPIYGQGISSAAQHCLILDSMLRSGAFSEKEFHIKVRRACAVPWMLGAIPDMAYPRTEIENIPITEKLLISPALWFLKGFMKCCTYDLQATKAFYYLLNLQQDHLFVVMNPLLILKVMYAAIVH